MKLKILITKNKNVLVSLFVLFLTFSVFSEADLQDRAFDKQEMMNYAESDDFSYMNLVVHPPSIWERLQWWFASLISKLFSNPSTPWLTELVFYSMLFLVLGIAIYYILRLRYGGGFVNATQRTILGQTHLEASGKTDYERFISEAVQAQNYKLAIRYVYLKTLAFLAQKQLIKLKEWKSPFDYDRELSHELVPIYQDLSKLFEYVWYGDFNASEADFKRGSKLASELQQKVK